MYFFFAEKKRVVCQATLITIEMESLGKCLFCSLHHNRAFLVCEQEVPVTKYSNGVFIVSKIPILTFVPKLAFSDHSAFLCIVSVSGEALFYFRCYIGQR